MNTTNKTDIYRDDVKLLMDMLRFVCSPAERKQIPMVWDCRWTSPTELVEFTFSFYCHIHHYVNDDDDNDNNANNDNNNNNNNS